MPTNLILDSREAITETTLIHLRTWLDEDAAAFMDERMVALESIWKTSFVERGWIALEFEERLLWQHIDDPATGLPFTSKERYIATRCPQSRSDVYAALKAVKELRDVPREALREMPRCNINVLQSLSSKVRQQPEVLEAAKTMTEKQFTAKIASDYPSQHLEQKRKVTLNFSDSAFAVYQQFIQAAEERENCTSAEQSVEMAIVNWMADNISAEES